jgi:hypothetical protein
MTKNKDNFTLASKHLRVVMLDLTRVPQGTRAPEAIRRNDRNSAL